MCFSFSDLDGVYMCVHVCVCLTSAPPVSGVCVRSLQVEEAVREVLVVAVFGLLDHLVLWIERRQNNTCTRSYC